MARQVRIQTVRSMIIQVDGRMSAQLHTCACVYAREASQDMHTGLILSGWSGFCLRMQIIPCEDQRQIALQADNTLSLPPTPNSVHVYLFISFPLTQWNEYAGARLLHWK